MKLELGNIFIKDICFASQTEIREGTLYVNKEALLAAIADERLFCRDIHIVKPGESVRLCPVKDVLEPRVKVEGNGSIFPGFFGDYSMVGQGRTHVLKGMAVVTLGTIVGFQEGIIDMSGPGAEYTPFSKTLNLVIDCDKNEGVNQHEHEEAIRLTGLKATRYIAEAARDLVPDEIKVYETKSISEQAAEFTDLPKIAYVYMLQTQGLLHDTYLYGVDVKRLLPTYLSPTEVMDGAVVSGNCVSACDKNTTYHHLNNPVILDLYARHGIDLNFMGVVVTNENVTLADKIRSSDFCAKLVANLGVDGVIITEEGFGNPDTDLIMNCKKIEQAGIRTVLITDEYAGQDGASQSLADADPMADAVVSAGNANEIIVLPPMDKVIGFDEAANTIAGGFANSRREDGSIEVEIQAIIGATNELGFSSLCSIGK